MSISILISAWLVGALGGLHCLTMCGGFVSAVAARDAASRNQAVLLPARTIAQRQLAYHAGRVATYVLLGAAFGVAGAVAFQAATLLPLQRGLYVAANVVLLLLGLSLAFGTPGIAWLQRAGVRVFGTVLPIVRPVLMRPGVSGRVALGLVWGLVPCALVYSVLPLALFAGGAWQGAAVMLAFGLGTVPNLFAAGMLLDRTKLLLEHQSLRYAAAAIIVTFALAGMYRALWVPAALAQQGAFCL